jgi:tRNA(fMet)-specific endonuclease VapC
MIVLDTDHLSELQYPNSVRGTRLARRLSLVEGRSVVTSIVTFEEQMRGWLAMVHKHSAGMNQVMAYANLVEVLRFYADWDVLPFDRASAELFHDLRSKRIRIKTMDLKIAAITLARSATLLSANLRDFRQVPNLSVEDWLA